LETGGAIKSRSNGEALGLVQWTVGRSSITCQVFISLIYIHRQGRPVALDKWEGVVKTKVTRAVREDRVFGQRD